MSMNNNVNIDKKETADSAEKIDKIVICDDDKDIVRALQIYLSNRNYELLCAYTGREALDFVKKGDVSLVLLDIMMPLLNGMDAARELREHNLISKIVFLTTSPEFAIESYDVDASGYLLKPVDREKLYKLLDKCLSAVSKPADSIAVHTTFGYQNVLMHHIEFIEAQNKKVMLALYDGQRLEVIGRLSDYEKLLTVEKGFFKCHRSYIVYMPAVEHFSATELVTKSGTKISISRGLSKSFQDAYFSYMFKE